MTIEQLSKNKLYLVGVSGGPDSMALLNMLLLQKLKLVVCFVNYHTRKESNLEETLVTQYCLTNHIAYETYSTFYQTKNGNFEAWARKERYDFFKRIYLKYKADGLLIAHHQDDLLETYLLQLKRNSIVKYYGLSEKTQMNGMNIYRPLLRKTKQELLQYCQKNSIPFSIDSTNLLNCCNRNIIRHTKIEQLDQEKRRELLNEIEKKNADLKKDQKAIKSLLVNKTYDINHFKKLSYRQQKMFLYHLMYSYERYKKITTQKILECRKVILSEKPNLIFEIDEKRRLVKDYDEFQIMPTNVDDKYVYIMSKPGILDTEVFSCDFNGDTTRLKITSDSYPLTFRSARKDDYVIFGNIRKKMNRIMIDEKIPLSKRPTYPIVVDKKGKIVYIPLYNSDSQKTIAKLLHFVVK